MLLAKLNVELTQNGSEKAAKPARLQRDVERLQRDVEKMDMLAKLKGE
jgi:hypothetical protein